MVVNSRGNTYHMGIRQLVVLSPVFTVLGIHDVSSLVSQNTYHVGTTS